MDPSSVNEVSFLACLTLLFLKQMKAYKLISLYGLLTTREVDGWILTKFMDRDTVEAHKYAKKIEANI